MVSTFKFFQTNVVCLKFLYNFADFDDGSTKEMADMEGMVVKSFL